MPYLIPIFSLTTVLVIRGFLLETGWIVLGKRVSAELLNSFSAGHVVSARLNTFGLYIMHLLRQDDTSVPKHVGVITGCTVMYVVRAFSLVY